LPVGSAVGLSSKECIGMHSCSSLLVLYEGIRCENLYSWFCRIHVLFSSFFWLFKWR